jgi:hypothetical protein
MAKTKTPDGEKCERSLPFKLDDDLKARRGETAGALNKKLDEATEKKKNEMAKHNEGIKKLTAQIGALLKAINEGVERRNVTCTAVKNFESNKIEFWFEGIILEEVEMKPGDRQLDLKDKSMKPAALKNERWQKMGPKYKPKTIVEENEEDAKREEIASVHKMETSRKGASSAVDPK